MENGFIGIGAMGECMVRNLLKAGHQVSVFNRTRARAELLAADGAHIANSIEGAASNPVVITMLANDESTAATVFESGFLAALPAGGIHVCMATISAALAARLAENHHAAGQAYVSAPVFGRPLAAAAAQLFIAAAGREDVLTRCQPLFDAMGQRTFHLGESPEAANVVKIAGNFMIASLIETFGEACALTRNYGIEAAQFLDVMTNSIFPAPIYKIYGGLIADERFQPPGFSLRLGLKDIRLVLAAADDKEIALPLASLIRDNYLKAITRGDEALDWAALALVAQEDAGLPRRN